MPTYHFFSKGYYVAKLEKEEGLKAIEYPPAPQVTEFEEFDDPQLPEPGTDWVNYEVKPVVLSNGEKCLIAVHGEEPDEHTIESMIIKYR